MELPDQSFWGEAKPQVSNGVFRLLWFSDDGLTTNLGSGLRVGGRTPQGLESHRDAPSLWWSLR